MHCFLGAYVCQSQACAAASHRATAHSSSTHRESLPVAMDHTPYHTPYHTTIPWYGTIHHTNNGGGGGGTIPYHTIPYTIPIPYSAMQPFIGNGYMIVVPFAVLVVPFCTELSSSSPTTKEIPLCRRFWGLNRLI
jgi:hypothetical protein